MRIPLPQFPFEERSPSHIAEVINSNSTEFTADCIPPEELGYAPVPPIGGWVMTMLDSNIKIVGVVVWAEMGVVDSIHRPVVLGLTIDQLREEQPQIFGLIHSSVRVLSVGVVKDDENIFHQVPPQPAQIHQAVHLASPEFVKVFCQEPGWLELLLNSGQPLTDAVIAASLRYAYECTGRDRSWLVKTSRQLNIWLRDDYDRLRRILSQLALKH